MDQPGVVNDPARGQLNRQHVFPLSSLRNHLALVNPGAAAAPFHKLRWPPVARLVATDVGCSVPPVRESAARYESAAGLEPFLPAVIPRRLPEYAVARDI